MVSDEVISTAGAAGLRWALDQPLSGDGVYQGAAGVLRAVSEAVIGGWDEFEAAGLGLRDRLLARAPLTRPDPTANPWAISGSEADPSLYDGAAGCAAALGCWAAATDDDLAGKGVDRVVEQLAAAEVPQIRDLLLGAAGVLAMLVQAGERQGSSRFAEALAEAGEPAGAGIDWRMLAAHEAVMPNFSHGSAGVAFALARAGVLLERDDLVDLARSGATRLLELGRRPDGQIAVPHSVPQQDWAAPLSWGWCHGPTGTVQLFLQLAALEPGWEQAVDGCLQAIRSSGLPARLYPGFWDNVGQCCGTAGVGELALDRYQATGNDDWLDWADTLADDLLTHATPIPAAPDQLCWSNFEHTAEEPVLPPQPGWMQGAAGVASFLLRLARVHNEGRTARRLVWPDRL